MARADKAPEPARRARYEAAAAQALAPLNPLLSRLEALTCAPMQVTPPQADVAPARDSEVSLTRVQTEALMALIQAPPPPSGLVYRVKKVFGRHKPRHR